MCEQCAGICLGVDELHGLAVQIVQAVQIAVHVADCDIRTLLLDPDDRLKQVACTVLNKLSDGMQVGGECRGYRENALVLFALRLCVQLLVPLAEHNQCRIVIDQNFRILALAVQNIADRCIAEAVVVLRRAVEEGLTRLCGAAHHLCDVDAGSGDRQQTDSGQNRETAAHIIRYDKGLVALCGGELLQCAARLVCRGKNAFLCALLAILLFAQLLKNAECNCRLGGSARFGNNIDAEIAVANDLDDIIYCTRADVVADEIDLRNTFRANAVVHLTEAEFDCRTRAQIRSADADDNQYITALLNLFRRLLNACKLFLIIFNRKIDPAEEVVSLCRFVHQHLIACPNQRIHIGELFLLYEGSQSRHFQFH